MKKVIVLNKKEGKTPLEALDSFRARNKIDKSIKMTYAGRLDPMANGLLLVLAGSETKNKEKYLKFDKEYCFEVLFGFSTDTYDILGKVINQSSKVSTRVTLVDEINKNLKFFTGKFFQKYPIFSSKTVKSRPLFSYARSEETVDIPSREVNIKSLKFIRIMKINNKKLLENIEKRIKKVNGDFRQKEILKLWRKKLLIENNFFIASFEIKCSSGTYVRGIANSLGEKIKIPALAFSIKRTRVGKYVI